jgi:uncharacterized protein
MNTSTSTLSSAQAAPWWTFGHVWLIISGPAIVVVAAFITLYLAVTRPDPVVADDYYRQGMELNKTLNEPTTSLAPAMQARNHAATGVVPGAVTGVGPKP